MPSGQVMNVQGRRGRVTTAYNRGFTLLELLISMTILAMIVTIMFAAFRIGVRAWEKGEKDVSGRQRQRIVLDLIKHQLASICVTDVRDGNGQPVFFKGDHRSMAFVSHIPLTGGLPGLAYVKYAVLPDPGDDNVRLTFYEEIAAVSAGETGAREPDEADFSELLSGMKSIGFEYLKIRPDEQESPWQESWDPAVEPGPPRAIRITLRENDAKAPVYVIAAAGS